MGLRTKFNLAMLAAFAVGFLIAAVVLDRVFENRAREEVLQNARLMMAAANAVRSYTVQEIVPLLPFERGGKFVPQTVPAYAAQKNFRELKTSLVDYAYREPALNPTNPANRAQDWEADIINALRNDPAKQELVAQRDTTTGRLLHLARPITVRTEACLTCHSIPSAAPAALTATYGTANGFGWKLNETIGAQILTVPMALAIKEGRESLLTFLGILTLIFLVIIAVLNVLLHFLVLRPVRRLSAMAEAASLGEEVESYVKPGKDEISSLSGSFDRLRHSLDQAMQMLKS